MGLLTRIATTAYSLGARPAARNLAAALDDPQAAQLRCLARAVEATRGTDFAHEHGLDALGTNPTIAQLRAAVPLRTWDDYAPWIDRIAAGEQSVLTHDPVRFLEPTGGSSGASKLVPYTFTLQREVNNATAPWIRELISMHPVLRSGRAYWSISPPAREATHTSGGVPIGAAHDTDYFPPIVRRAVAATLAVPAPVARITDLDACRHVTLLALLAREDLGLMSAWNPSFLTLLARALDERWPALLADLESGRIDPALDLDPTLRSELERAIGAHAHRASDLRRAFGGSAPTDLGGVWPRLALISCWTDAHAARAVPGLRERFPRVPIQGKGLLATEGVVSVPFAGHDAPVAAATAHLLEFLPVDAGGAVDTDAPLLLHQLASGARYEVVLTTGGGLLRYRLRDVVEVAGIAGRTPTLRFVGRADEASDLAGEKLTPAFVDECIASAATAAGLAPAPYALLVPDTAPPAGAAPCYALLVDSPAEVAARLAAAVEDALGEAYHYALCRRLGQLGPVRAACLPGGEAAYEAAARDGGQRAGTIKPTALVARHDLAARLTERSEFLTPAAWE